jgi:hypothetical protein
MGRGLIYQPVSRILFPADACTATSTSATSHAHCASESTEAEKRLRRFARKSQEDPLLQLLAILAFYAACVLVLITVHESGHYLAGLCAGIPARDMRIRLLRFPQHVALRDGAQWVSPISNIERYINLQWQHLKTTPRVYIYVSGGLILETMFTVCLSVALIAIDQPKIAFALAGMSLLLFLPWLVIDGISVCRGRIAGDLSGLWFLSRVPTLLLLVIVLASRVAILWYAVAQTK